MSYDGEEIKHKDTCNVKRQKHNFFSFPVFQFMLLNIFFCWLLMVVYTQPFDWKIHPFSWVYGYIAGRSVIMTLTSVVRMSNVLLQ